MIFSCHIFSIYPTLQNYSGSWVSWFGLLILGSVALAVGGGLSLSVPAGTNWMPPESPPPTLDATTFSDARHSRWTGLDGKTDGLVPLEGPQNPDAARLGQWINWKTWMNSAGKNALKQNEKRMKQKTCLKHHKTLLWASWFVFLTLPWEKWRSVNDIQIHSVGIPYWFTAGSYKANQVCGFTSSRIQSEAVRGINVFFTRENYLKTYV